MNTNLSMPSGSEVESAAFHQPLSGGVPVSVTPVHPGGWRGRLDSLRSQGVSRLHHVQHVVGDRSSALRGSLQRSVRGSASHVRSSMQTNPMKWAGIAAGSGLAIGLLGRLIQARNRRLRSLPQLVVIEAAC